MHLNENFSYQDSHLENFVLHFLYFICTSFEISIILHSAAHPYIFFLENCQLKHKMVQPLRKTVQLFPIKLKIECLYDPDIPIRSLSKRIKTET